MIIDTNYLIVGQLQITLYRILFLNTPSGCSNFESVSLGDWAV